VEGGEVIRYIIADATVPTVRPVIIAHVVNDLGGWGSGFVVPLGRRYPAAERAYRTTLPKLGETQIVNVEPDVWVANMCAQRGFPSRDRPCALDYGALAACLRGLPVDIAIQMPRIGCGIAGGEWARVAEIVEASGLDVTVIDLPVSP
jgi:hypothetical protein